MNRIVKIVRYILTIILTLLIIIFTIKNKINNHYISLDAFDIYGLVLITFSTYILYLILSIIDIIKKEKIINDQKFNILQIFLLSIMTIVFVRCNFDFSFYISKIIPNFYGQDAIAYMTQNIYFFLVLLVLILAYREINIEKEKTKPSKLSIILLIISIMYIPLHMIIIKTLDYIYEKLYLSGDNTIIIMIIPIIIMIITVYDLFKNSYKTKNWPIYIIWLLNLISIHLIYIGW